MSPWLAVFIFVVGLALVVFWCCWFRDRGYKSGVRDGYTQGYRDADNWWIRAETDIKTESCRQAIKERRER